MSDRFVRRARSALVGLTLCAGISGALLAATAGTASANVPQLGAGTTQLLSASSGLVLDVEGASTQPGAPVIQWLNNGQNNQYWNVPASNTGTPGLIQNLNSGQCLSTDGIAGDQLYQYPCEPNLAVYQQWYVESDNVPGQGVVELLQNGAFNLWVDVGGGRNEPNAPIIAWPVNEQTNQMFIPEELGGGLPPVPPDGAANTGPQDPAGSPGPGGRQGPDDPGGGQAPAEQTGATSRQSQDGRIELVTCDQVKVTVKDKRVTRRKCTTRRVSGTDPFTTTPARATLTRGGLTYATGTANHGRLLLHSRRRVTAGRYTLLLRYRLGHRWITARKRVTIA